MATFFWIRPGRVPAVLAGAMLAIMISACAQDPEDLPYVERPVESIYNNAMNALESREYQIAAQMFDEVERQHPYSVWATKAQLMAAYAHYLQNNYADAVNALDRFLQLHPGHEDAPYALYLKGLCSYERISDVSRDQGHTEEAKKTFEELMRRFPESRYAQDAERKLVLIRDHLAGKEMVIGRYYLRRGEHLAAINRFRQVVDEYDTTAHVPEALHRLTEAYLALGLVDEAKRSAAVLGHNFSRSAWYRDSYRLLAGMGALGSGGGENGVAEDGVASHGTDGTKPAKSESSFLSRAWNWLF